METTQCPSKTKGYKILITYKMKYYSAIKEGNLAFARKDGPAEYYAK